MSGRVRTSGSLADQVDQLFDDERFEEAITLLEQEVAGGRADARAWQMLGLARRELLDSAGAVTALTHAATLAPHDVRIAHALARSTLEAGHPASAAYERALALAPSDAGLIVGHAAALAGDGHGSEGQRRLEQVLAANPGWYDGHMAFARLSASVAPGSDTAATVRGALARFPLDATLWRVALRLLLDEVRYDEVKEAADQAEARLGDDPEWRRARAIALSETGEAAEAQRLFDGLPPDGSANGLVQRVRNLIRLMRFDEAAGLLEPKAPTPEGGAVLWPYRALLWRHLGDARWQWLEGDPRLIGSYPLGLGAADLARLADLLRGLHQRSGLLPDQSVRRGTQTDGNLLARAEPEIVRLRAALLEAVASHIDQLPPPTPGHPTLGPPRAPVRISGSWSVRLTNAGFHVDHVHPHGWLSSAFYVALPQADDARQEGWLAFGENRSLLPDLTGFRTIKPTVGTLVLFPSTMWHGTRPFGAGERMTVAFDIARPRGR